ncbi:carbamoyltransferase HypF [uncultured Megasphaera sp.]|mgnify:FL=1|jgi:hydrogenase maturation protein HypF|uniref:carbamoyltransferase HypF n=1 Tax=uncultured Megasphaera sp. TaxID=165188 RepID=UPI0025D754FB|nr:carbamoyltransferase HypF [uncultured Megasphaera sp.]
METERICVIGIVQGVGFRPFVSRLAHSCHIRGTVCNKGSYVEIIIQGSKSAKEQFVNYLPRKAPARSAILKIMTEQTDLPPFPDFSIIESAAEEGDVFVSPDIAICDDCKKELFDPQNRRYLHPFINCTACGPRMTILDAMPYDRERTSMAEFPMCSHCEYEYTHRETRRYDAQPVCCPDCGPEVYILDSTKRGREAIVAARRALSSGRIVAVKGIGGYHLCCDAFQDDTVQRLRRLKHRPAKPFAVMMKDLAAVRRHCHVPKGAEPVLDGHEKPIVLLEKRPGSTLAPSLAPQNPFLGIMLPYTPLHLLLFTYDDGLEMPEALVMTSANTSGAPICHDEEEARQELKGMCDAILSHNRRIRLRADDSVVDWYGGSPYMIRRSRGYAPLPFFYGREKGTVLALGGELKNCFCLARDRLYYLSPYVGDMADVRTVQALRDGISRMKTLLGIEPSCVACDLHPRYNTTAVAQEMGLPVIPVQHHFAHILSCMAENDWKQPVLGVAFDGTGYGTDGTVWGGEILLCDGHEFCRSASIAPFWQRGGDAAAREGWRIAVSLIASLYRQTDEAAAVIDALYLCSREERQMQFFMAQQGLNSVVSTSAGRLFDGVSAILGLARQSSFEGEAAMQLQFAARRWMNRHEPVGKDPVPPQKENGRWILPTGELVRYMAEEKLAGRNQDFLAYAFHEQLARQIAGACLQLSQETGVKTVALSGGVFQNTLLLSLCEQSLKQAGLMVLRHHLVPPNDGGIALGQAVYAMANQNR